MSNQFERTKVLITVMTYPHPSRSHNELVCTAGITESGDWVRLYPIDYRYRPRQQQFKKYQWIEVELESRGASNDQRKESRKPNLDSIKLLGEPLSSENDWRLRTEFINRLPHHTLLELKRKYEEDKTSLGIVRPAKILDLEVKVADTEWKPEWQNLFSQMTLFGPQQKPLKKIPFSFHYIFQCDDDDDKPHRAMCEDWELGVLFLKEVERLGNERAAAENVKKKFFDQLCDPSRDTRFFMGTFFPYNSWLVLGVFWPPKQLQSSLF